MDKLDALERRVFLKGASMGVLAFTVAGRNQQAVAVLINCGTRKYRARRPK
jgi:hypothetical protein